MNTNAKLKDTTQHTTGWYKSECHSERKGQKKKHTQDNGSSVTHDGLL